MIRAVFFDFYGTLAQWAPAAEAVQQAAAAAEGVDLDEQSIARGYLTANAYMDDENARYPIRERLEAERASFFAEYERRLLAAAGAEASLDAAARIWSRVSSAPKDLALYPDARQALENLGSLGLTLGVVSNMGSELDGWLERLGVSALLPVRATSASAGVNKPHRGIFEWALAAAGVSAQEAVHVGDSVEADVEGARAAGIEPVYVQRSAVAPPPAGVRTAGSLMEAADCVRELVRVNG